MNEGELMNSIRAALNVIPNVRFFRNNTGVDTQRGIRYGLGVGSADLIGLVAGRFVALEVKTPSGRVSPDQTRWLDAVACLGGVSAVVRSVDEAMSVVDGVLRG